MKLIVAVGVLLLVSLVTCRSVPKGADPPKWDKSYVVTGTLSLPYAELEEPFMAYFDPKMNRSRMDFYGNIVQTFTRGDVGKYGSTYKLAYMTTGTNATSYNVRGCFKTDGDVNTTVSPQSVLPDLTNFKQMGDAMLLEGKNVTMWYMVDTHGSKTSKYTMYLSADDMSPVRYEMYGYDSLLGSHFDKYYVDYSDFSEQVIPEKMFYVPDNDTCGGFPGPGDAESRILMNPMREYINHDDTHHQEMFAQFKAKHNKNYADEKEHASRESIFRQNVRYIHSKNRSPITYTLAVNHIADLSRTELRMMNGRRPSKGYNGGQPFNKNLYTAPLPDSLDWRLFGAVNPVKDQAVCGSCWSFGTTGTIEGAYFLATGKLIRLSQQELMDCSWGQGNNACDGGEDFRAYQWIMQNKGGLASEDSYGMYKGQDWKCRSKNVTGTAQLDSYVNVTSGDQEALKLAMFSHGPISVGIDASHLSLSFYANGVYYEEACRNDPDGLDHAVLAVGYGVMHGQEYWLVKNSWSTYWGNDGYVLMSQKNNNCGVATDATFVRIAK